MPKVLFLHFFLVFRGLQAPGRRAQCGPSGASGGGRDSWASVIVIPGAPLALRWAEHQEKEELKIQQETAWLRAKEEGKVPAIYFFFFCHNSSNLIQGNALMSL